jgi:hypothetical protein
MNRKTAVEKLLDSAAVLVAMGIPSIPLIWLLRLPDDRFRQLFHGIRLNEFHVLEAIAAAVWLIVFIPLNRVFERILDRLLRRPRTPWLKR